MENSTLDVIMNRVSLREYDPKPLTREEEDTIIKAAIQAPTAGNQMLYSMIICRDQALKDELSELCDHQPMISRAPFVVAFVADQHRWFDYYRMNDIPKFCEETGRHYADPSVGDLVLSIDDTMAAAENSVIAAESIGIGSCYIGDFIENYERVKELLRLPKETFPVVLLCFGHYKEGYKKVFRKRFDREYAVFENSYHQLTEDEYKEMFREREIRDYNKMNRYGATTFAQQFYSRKMAADFRHEMNRSVIKGILDWCQKEEDGDGEAK